MAVFKENRKVLHKMVRDSNHLSKRPATAIQHHALSCDACSAATSTPTLYVQVVDYLSEVTKALDPITRPAFEHIDNNHEGMSKEQIVDLMRVNDQVEDISTRSTTCLPRKTSRISIWCWRCDRLFDTIVEAIKSQLRRIKSNPRPRPGASVLYLTILNETKTMVLRGTCSSRSTTSWRRNTG